MIRCKILNALYFFIFAVSGFLVYSNTFEVPFVFDDIARILENKDIRMSELTVNNIIKASFGKKSSSKRPIGNLSLAFNYYFNGYNLTGYHIVNILIHIFTGVFLFLFIKCTLRIHEHVRKDSAHEISDFRCPGINDKSYKAQLNQSLPGITSIAFFSALLWFANPIHTQSVTYIVQRMNSMAAMFCLLALLFYVKGRTVIYRQKSTSGKEKYSKGKIKPGIRLHYLYFFGSALAWILALGSKQTAATLPFLVFLYEYFFFQDLSRKWIRHNFKYLLMVLLVFAIVAFFFLGLNPQEKISSLTDYSNKAFTFAERLLTQPRVILYYISLIFFPHPSRLNLDHDFPLSHSLTNPITTLFSLLTIIAVILLACFISGKYRLLSFSILWFLVNLAIESSVIPLALIFEHRTYLPSMLIYLPIVLSAYRFIKHPGVTAGFFCLVIIIFAIWTYQRNNIWRDSSSLWADSAKKSPNKARPFNNLGVAFEDMGLLDKAAENYFQALSIRPDYAEASVNLGVVLKQKGLVDEAVNYYSKALQIDYDNWKAHYNLGIVLESKNQPDNAMRHYLQALRINPDYSNAHINLGIVLTQKGRLDEAIQHFLIASELEPDSFDIHNNIGNALNQKGLFDEAIKYYLKALSVNPYSANTYNNLGTALARKGNIREAVDRFKEALRIDPDFKEALNNLEQALIQEKEG